MRSRRRDDREHQTDFFLFVMAQEAGGRTAEGVFCSILPIVYALDVIRISYFVKYDLVIVSQRLTHQLDSFITPQEQET